MSFLAALGRPRGIARRLVLTLILIALVGAVTGWVVAQVVGPAVFNSHLLEAESSPGTTFEHARQAFTSGSTVTLAVALGASAVASLAVGLVAARRIAASLSTMSAAAARVASGHFEQRVEASGIGSEFDQFAESFNEMAAQLDHQESLRRRLMADVAHELRTPVATISVVLEAVEDGIRPLDSSTTEILRDQSSRLTRLAEDLAAVSRAEAGTLQLTLRRVSPAALLANAAGAARERYAAAGVNLTVDADEALPAIPIDPDRFGQVLTNLLENALRHTPAGGQVTLRAAVSGTTARITVADTGEGIAAADLPYIFERFYRVDTARSRAQGGSGIGLTITRALVHAHGGTITAFSDGPGTGTRFIIELPGTPASDTKRV
ncbi:HAMP domain-containing sensor histidine kinase [Microbacterium laevaniformans]|uniref:histidine kinase n=1 Tax=Microbacterium laevaniformans TaxID=36807 RepID=A0A150HI12_9MICO|nr:ATP-binding protein [Microbacterium laevaniformans]KXZ61408.1 Signal transduction histidine-protein kinase BaeS [Microbacterium laevaniformans]GLJ64669.1 putative sensor histidine kinase [Microbacterium laevaniformans]